MKPFFAAALGVSLICAAVHAVQAGELADSWVEKTLGASGIQHESKTQTKRGMTFTDIHYLDAKGQSLVTLRLATPEQYAFWKQAAGGDARPLSGLGTEGFRWEGLKSVCAKAATTAACATPDYLNDSAKAITDAHLQALVKAAL
jgi:hypothetical protein